MIDRYFKHPLLYDYLLAFFVCATAYCLYYRNYIELPNSDNTRSIATDLSTVALTLAGFVLTLLTVLVTFKTGAKIPNGTSNEGVPLFDLFFSTSLYYRTTELLKGCIKSLIFIALMGFSLKIFLTDHYAKFMFFSNILSLSIIFTTLWRSLKILTNIIKLQKEQ